MREARYAFTTTLNGPTSLASSGCLATVDLTAPVVALTVPASSPTRAPQLLVTASDLNGLPNGTTVGSVKSVSHISSRQPPAQRKGGSGQP